MSLAAAFAADLAAGMQYADALEKHVAGKGKVGRTMCLKTLQALTELDLDAMQGLLEWAKAQRPGNQNA